MRIRIARLLVTGERAQPGVPLRLAPAKAQAERGQQCSFQISESGHERQPCGGKRPGADEESSAAARAAATKRAADDRRRAEPAERSSDRAADRLVPIEG